MKRNVSVVRLKFRCNILISGKIIKEIQGSVASATLYITKEEQLFCSINSLVFLTEVKCVYCAVRDKFLNIL